MEANFELLCCRLTTPGPVADFATLLWRNKQENRVIPVCRLLRELAAQRSGKGLVSKPPAVTADRVQLRQPWMQLMINGNDAMKDVDETCGLTLRPERIEVRHVLILVSNTGVGPASQQADKMFEGLFTTRTHAAGKDIGSAAPSFNRIMADSGLPLPRHAAQPLISRYPRTSGHLHDDYK
jgi:hypothetical protein